MSHRKFLLCCNLLSDFKSLHYVLFFSLRLSFHRHSFIPSFCLLFFPRPLFLLFVASPGVSQEKIGNFLKRLRAEPRYLLAQNVSTCIDPLEVCLHRQTVQDTVHIFQHSIPTEGKPITNQKNSGRTYPPQEEEACMSL